MASKQDGVAALVNNVLTDGQALVKQQIELAKAELQYSAKQAAATSGMLVGAGVLGFLAFVFALVAAAYGLVAAGLTVWAGFLIVAGILLLVAIILGLLGRARSKKVGPPTRALAQVQETKAAISVRPGSAPAAGSAAAGAGATALDASTPAALTPVPAAAASTPAGTPGSTGVTGGNGSGTGAAPSA
jgi:hypothetical protein